jgi:hypothetical protein
MPRLLQVPILLLTTAFVACGGETESDVGLVARAGGHTWAVAEAADLLTPRTDLPAEREAVRALANLWIDYTLLARATMADSTLGQVDVGRLANDAINERLVLGLRDSIITVPPIRNDSLIERYRREATASAVRARQILIAWPNAAPAALKDSVRALARSLRTRIADGREDFGALARAHSQDPGSAASGGELGTIRRGQLLPALDSALFSLEPGVVSQPVESPYGVHLIRVDERVVPTVEQFGADLLNRRAAEAESLFIAGLEVRASVAIMDGADARVRDLARNYRTPLEDRDAKRPLLQYDGGSVTEGDVLWYLQSQPPELRTQVAASHDRSITDRVLRTIVHRKLLVAEARRLGRTPSTAVAAQVAATARRNLREAAKQLGLFPIPVSRGQRPAEVVDSVVSTLLADILSGARREVTPLGVMSYLLRDDRSARVVESGLDEVVRLVEARRAAPRDSASKDSTARE